MHVHSHTINFENVKSFWKQFMPRMASLYMDQLSEHQRDLTNSASQRFFSELLAVLYLNSERLNRTLKKTVVDSENIRKNLLQNRHLNPGLSRRQSLKNRF